MAMFIRRCEEYLRKLLRNEITNNYNVTITMDGQNFHYKQLHSCITSKKTYLIAATITLACITWIVISRIQKTSQIVVQPGARSNILSDITVNQYNIHITPDIENRYYDGYVEIIFNTTSEIDGLDLLAVADIEAAKILRKNLLDFDNRNYTTVTLKNNQSLETLLVTFNDKLKIGEYKLCIKYKSKMVVNHSESGFYLHQQIDEEYNKKGSYNLFTNADYDKKHYIFPCFSKIQIESVFNLSLTIPSSMEAHANAHRGSIVRRSSDSLTYNFDIKTMSLASVGFAITADMSHKQFDKKDWYIYTREKLIDSYCVTFMTQITKTVLYSLEQYFQPRLTFNKLHIIIIPDDQVTPITRHFSDLLIFSEKICANINDGGKYEFIDKLAKILTNSILDQWLEQTFSSEDHKQNEIAFLKGLKLFLVSYIIEGNHTAGRRTNSTNYVDIFNSFRREITRKHLTTQEDGFDYDPVKISMIFLMLQNSLIAHHFRHTLLNVLTDEKIRVKPIAEKFHYFQSEINSEKFQREEKLGNWFNFVGFPIITISLNHLYKSLKFTSQGITDFYEINKFNNSARNSVKITIPVTFTTPPQFKFNGLDTVIHVNNDKSSQVHSTNYTRWIIANIQQSGYYRVNYEESHWREIITFLTANDQNHKIIHVVNRAKLIDDAAHLADAGYLRYNILFGLMKYLRFETDLLPWLTTKNAIKYLEHKLLDSKPVYHKFKEMIKELFINYYVTYVILTKAEERVYMEEYEFAVKYGCYLQLPHCLSAASSMFDDWTIKKDINELTHKEMRLRVCNAIRYGVGSEFDFMMEYYLTVSDDYKKNIMETLSCTQSIENMKKYIELTLDQTKSENNLLQNGIKRMLTNINGMEVILTFLQDKYSEINKLNKAGIINIDDIVLAVSDKLNPDKYENWFQKILPLLKLRDDTKEKIQHIIAYNRYWIYRNFKINRKTLNKLVASLRLV